ncbi:MAG TPA: hypothetical protein VF613_21585, partial [Longimicrobium sp.]
MAIDLINKLDRAPGARAPWEDDSGTGPEDPATIPYESLIPRQRDSLEFAYQQSRSHADPRYVVGDPAAWGSDFGYAL